MTNLYVFNELSKRWTLVVNVHYRHTHVRRSAQSGRGSVVRRGYGKVVRVIRYTIVIKTSEEKYKFNLL